MRASRTLSRLIAVIFFIVTGFATLWVVRTYFVSYYQVASDSMADTYHKGDIIFAGKRSYLGHDPQRGDVVIYHPPTKPLENYIHRIIGLPGETIVIRDGKVYLENGNQETLLDEPYLSEKSRGNTYGNMSMSSDASRFVVPANAYMLMGDNRMGSLDSRFFTDTAGNPAPFVPRDSIIGKVW